MTQNMGLNSKQDKLVADGAKMYDPTLKSSTKELDMSKIRILKNLLIMSLGFLFIFSSYMGLANVQSTLNSEENAGVVSLSVLYATMIISSMFLPKFVIRKFGCKATIVTCSLMVIPYTATNFYPRLSTLVPASFFSGLAAPPLWSSMSTYLNDISVSYARQTSESANVLTARFFGIFYMLYQTSQIFGNMATYFVLKPPKDSKYDIVNTTYSSCGAEYCFEINENMKSPSDEQTYLLLGMFMLSGVLGVLFFATLLDNLERKFSDENASSVSRILDIIKQMKNTKQILISPLIVFSGLKIGFFVGDFTKAYIACAWGIEYVGLVFMFFGVVSALFSFISGHLIKYIPRVIIILIAAIGNMAVCVALLLWQPNSEEYILFFILAGVWGISEGIWQTLLSYLYGILFRSEEEAAFSNYRLWESVGFTIAFACSSLLCISPKIYLVLTLLTIGMMGYVTVEILLLLEDRTRQQEKVLES